MKFWCAHAGTLKIVCKTNFMHCYHMHYDHFYCIRFLVQPNVLSDAHGASAVWVNHPALLGKTFHIYYQVYMTYPIESR